MLTNGLEPTQNIGPHCNSPFECDFIHFCWKHVPEHSVFELANANGKDWELYDNGVLRLTDIPDDFKLNPKQKIQVQTVRDGKGYTDVKEIQQFLSTWDYPLHFFDFETIGGAIPLLDGTKPFEQIPFQYSLHIIRHEGAEPEHFEFLSDPKGFVDFSVDPRLDLIKAMKAHFEGNGSIVAYNASFEKRVIERLASAFPNEKNFLHSLSDRFVDLWDVYRKYWCYTPEMKGSASIKSVLPAIIPDFSYEDLQVQDGNDASAIFSSMIDHTFKGDITTTIKDLLAYCKLDTLAMVMLYRELLKV
jgi:hypothetical protein